MNLKSLMAVLLGLSLLGCGDDDGGTDGGSDAMMDGATDDGGSTSDLTRCDGEQGFVSVSVAGVTVDSREDPWEFGAGTGTWTQADAVEDGLFNLILGTMGETDGETQADNVLFEVFQRTPERPEAGEVAGVGISFSLTIGPLGTTGQNITCTTEADPPDKSVTLTDLEWDEAVPPQTKTAYYRGSFSGTVDCTIRSTDGTIEEEMMVEADFCVEGQTN